MFVFSIYLFTLAVWHLDLEAVLNFTRQELDSPILNGLEILARNGSFLAHDNLLI